MILLSNNMLRRKDKMGDGKRKEEKKTEGGKREGEDGEWGDQMMGGECVCVTECFNKPAVFILTLQTGGG